MFAAAPTKAQKMPTELADSPPRSRMCGRAGAIRSPSRRRDAVLPTACGVFDDEEECFCSSLPQLSAGHLPSGAAAQNVWTVNSSTASPIPAPNLRARWGQTNQRLNTVPAADKDKCRDGAAGTTCPSNADVAHEAEIEHAGAKHLIEEIEATGLARLPLRSARHRAERDDPASRQRGRAARRYVQRGAEERYGPAAARHASCASASSSSWAIRRRRQRQRHRRRMPPPKPLAAQWPEPRARSS